MTEYILFGFTYAFAAAAQPGPFQTFLIGETVKNGWKKTLPASLAPLVSDGPIIVLVLAVLSNVPDIFQSILQCAGGVYLLYLTYCSYKNYRDFKNHPDQTESSGKQTLLKAAFVNLLNPNPWLGWTLIMGPMFLKGWGENTINGIMLILTFYLTIAMVTAAMIILFAQAKHLGEKVSRFTIGLSVIGLFVFAIYSLYSGIKSISGF